MSVERAADGTVICPRCGAYGTMYCSTLTMRDHKARFDAELAGLDEEREAAER